MLSIVTSRIKNPTKSVVLRPYIHTFHKDLGKVFKSSTRCLCHETSSGESVIVLVLILFI